MTEILPNFFIVGAPKAGTTSLYYALDQHPQIYMSPLKEPCFFASEIRPDRFAEEHQSQIQREGGELERYLAGPMGKKRFGGMVSSWDDYLRLFQNATCEIAIGEASVCYLWSATAAKNIASRVPNAKLIMILRDPADRAFSQYLHTVTAGLVRESFREQVNRGLKSTGQKFGVLHPFLEFGLYSNQVKRYLELFPRENLGIHFYEDHRELVPEVLRLLGVDGQTVLPSQRHLEARIPRAIGPGYLLKKSGIWQAAKKITPPALLPWFRKAVFKPREAVAMEPQDRKYLVDYYREDILKLAGLLDRDLTAWLH